MKVITSSDNHKWALSMIPSRLGFVFVTKENKSRFTKKQKEKQSLTCFGFFSDYRRITLLSKHILLKT